MAIQVNDIIILQQESYNRRIFPSPGKLRTGSTPKINVGKVKTT